jgi:hypothetical protein
MSRNAFALLAVEDDAPAPRRIQAAPQVQVQAPPQPPVTAQGSRSAAPSPLRRVAYGWRPSAPKAPEPEPFLSASNFPALGRSPVLLESKPANGAWSAGTVGLRQALATPSLPTVKSPMPTKRKYSDQRARLAGLGMMFVHSAPDHTSEPSSYAGSSEWHDDEEGQDQDDGEGEGEWELNTW